MLVIKKDTNHLDETKLNKYESILFLACLKEEKIRHEQAKKYMVWMAYLHHESKVVSEFWRLGAINHSLDIDMIVKTMDYLIAKWEITVL